MQPALIDPETFSKQLASRAKHTRQTSSVDESSKKARLIDSQVFTERFATRQLLQPDRPRTPRLIDGLRALLRLPDASFKSPAQEEAIQSVLQRTPYITYISGTGSGKSLLFFLPYYLQPVNWHFFIITPRVSLKADLQQHATQF
jgi:superfamily II DNA helicase RecQ